MLSSGCQLSAAIVAYQMIVCADLAIYSSRMPTLDRRTLLYMFGIASVSQILPAQTSTKGKVSVAKPGESRFAFTTKQQSWLSACKLTAEDSGGTLSAFELNAMPQTGPNLHVHHREDEWYYVLSGEFQFKAGDESHTMPTGASIWLPRDIPHTWANITNAEAKLILVCQPGGFEKFFEEIGNEMANVSSAEAQQKMKQVMAKYGMELLGPPLLKPLRGEH
jgi:mannose-6-phosphate isomerase-like protein (cupin superfamily)